MRILLTSDNYYPNVNGASYAAQRLAHFLSVRGHEVSAVSASRRFRSETFIHNGIRIFGVPSCPVFFYRGFRFPIPFGMRARVARVVRECRPDVIHLQDHFAVSGAAQKVAAREHIPTLGTNHFMPENLVHYLHLPKLWERMAINLAWKQFRSVFEKVQIVTTPTATAARLLKDIHLSKPVRVVSNGIDLQTFSARTARGGRLLRERYGLPSTPLLLYVGRLDTEKNLDLILNALPSVIEKTALHFVIAGKGAEEKYLNQLVRRSGLERAVTFTGFVPDEDLPELYRTADCFIIAGIAELQSLVTMEAMASGLPVIAVDAMALPELVRHGENGFLFARSDRRACAECMVRIFSNQALRKRFSKRSVEMIREHDIKKTIDAYESLYNEITHR